MCEYAYFQKNTNNKYDLVSCTTGEILFYNVSEVKARNLLNGKSIINLKNYDINGKGIRCKDGT